MRIAHHCATSAESLRATYIRPIEDPYVPAPKDLPCVREQPFLAAKLLVPYVHLITAEGDNSGLLQLASKSSMEEQPTGAKT